MHTKTFEKKVLLLGLAPPLGGSKASFMQLITDLPNQSEMGIKAMSTNARAEMPRERLFKNER